MKLMDYLRIFGLKLKTYTNYNQLQNKNYNKIINKISLILIKNNHNKFIEV